MPTIISGDNGIDKVASGAVDLSSDVTGQLPQANGGTGATSLPAGGFSNMEVFTSSGTFTVPAGVTKVKVTVVGGGGNGGGTSGASITKAAGGGGAGGAAIKIVSGLTPSGTVSVTVGGAGGTSSFGAHCSATGGSDGSTGASGAAMGGAGGIGSSGNLNIKGQSGGWGFTTAANYNAGIGGSSILGGGVNNSIKDYSGNGTAGGAYGAGGTGASSGGSTNYSGGAGASGVVIVEY